MFIFVLLFRVSETETETEKEGIIGELGPGNRAVDQHMISHAPAPKKIRLV